MLERKGDGAAEVELQRLQSLRAGVLMREQLLLFEHLTRASLSALSCHMCFSQQPQELDAVIFNPTEQIMKTKTQAMFPMLVC